MTAQTAEQTATAVSIARSYKRMLERMAGRYGEAQYLQATVAMVSGDPTLWKRVEWTIATWDIGGDTVEARKGRLATQTDGESVMTVWMARSYKTMLERMASRYGEAQYLQAMIAMVSSDPALQERVAATIATWDIGGDTVETRKGR